MMLETVKTVLLEHQLTQLPAKSKFLGKILEIIINIISGASIHDPRLCPPYLPDPRPPLPPTHWRPLPVPHVRAHIADNTVSPAALPPDSTQQDPMPRPPAALLPTPASCASPARLRGLYGLPGARPARGPSSTRPTRYCYAKPNRRRPRLTPRLPPRGSARHTTHATHHTAPIA
jgi:hypothetical protein